MESFGWGYVPKPAVTYYKVLFFQKKKVSNEVVPKVQSAAAPLKNRKVPCPNTVCDSLATVTKTYNTRGLNLGQSKK